ADEQHVRPGLVPDAGRRRVVGGEHRDALAALLGGPQVVHPDALGRGGSGLCRIGHPRVSLSRHPLVTGSLRSRPNATGVTFGPGGYWRRFHSARSTSVRTRSTTAGSNPAATSSSRPCDRPTYASSRGSSTSYGGSESWSTWPGASSADGGLVIELSGIGGISPASSAAWLRHRASRHTRDLSTSLSGA